METQVFKNWNSLVEAVSNYQEFGFNAHFRFITYNGWDNDGAVIRDSDENIIAYLIYSPEEYENTEFKHRY